MRKRSFASSTRRLKPISAGTVVKQNLDDFSSSDGLSSSGAHSMTSHSSSLGLLRL
jgi:hypothetical protein